MRKSAEFLYEKHVGLADCAETCLNRVFRRSYATIWGVSLVLAMTVETPVFELVEQIESAGSATPSSTKMAAGQAGADQRNSRNCGAMFFGARKAE